MSPGNTNATLSAIERMDQRISGLSDRVDRSDERACSSRPSEEPARGKWTTRRIVEENNPGEPGEGGDDSDESGHLSDSDIPEGEPLGDIDDPTGGEDRNQVRININPLRGESVIRTATETRRFKEQGTVKVLKFPTLPNLSAWKLQVGKNLVAAGGRIDLREITWWAEASRETSNFDTLEVSGEDRFVSLDLELSTYLFERDAQGGQQ